MVFALLMAVLALAGADGALMLQPTLEYPGAGWNIFHALAGDIDADSQSDLVWTSVTKTSSFNNSVIAGISGGLRLPLPLLQALMRSVDPAEHLRLG